jgi:general secretion pathway protein G
MKRMRNEKGFTLIELLVVIVILGILAAVVVFAVSGLSDKGSSSACKIDTRTIRTAQEAYYAEPTAGNGAYAVDADELVAKGLLSEAPKYHTTDGTPAAGPYTGYTVSVADAKCGDDAGGAASLVDAAHPDNK